MEPNFDSMECEKKFCGMSTQSKKSNWKDPGFFTVSNNPYSSWGPRAKMETYDKCNDIANALLDEKTDTFKVLTRAERHEVAVFFVDFVSDPENDPESNSINLIPPSASPLLIAYMFANQMATESQSITLPKSEFSRELLNFCSIPSSYNDDDYKGFAECELIAIGKNGCDVDALVDVCVKALAGAFYKLSKAFLQAAVVDEFDVKLRSSLAKLQNSGSESTAEDQKLLAEVKKLGIRAVVVGELLITYDTISANLNLPEVPTLNIIPYRTDAELVKLVRDIPTHICCATIWGPDIAQNQNIAASLPCSTVWINTFGDTSIPTPICDEEHTTVNRKQVDGTIILKLLKLDELDDYRNILIPWLKLNESAAPRDANVRVNTLGPYGRVTLSTKLTKDCEGLVLLTCFAALACGNTVGVSKKCPKSVKSIVKKLTKALPPKTCELVEISDEEDDDDDVINDVDFRVNDRDVYLRNYYYNRRFKVDKAFLLNKFLKFQYVWLPKVENI